MFYDCNSLTSITIPNSVTSLERSVFDNCNSLTSITIPNSVISIGNGAFYNCSSLTSISIPRHVTFIGTYAFLNCTELSVVQYFGEKQPNCGIGIFNGTKVDRIFVQRNYKDISFADYEIFIISTNYFTIGNLPPTYIILKIGIFLFPLFIP